MSLHQGRGARLSFLSHKKTSQPSPVGEDKKLGQSNGDSNKVENMGAGGRGHESQRQGRENTHRRSFFRTHASDATHSLGVNGSIDDLWAKETKERLTERPRSSIDTSATLERKESVSNASLDSLQGPAKRGGSVRKRLSLLKLGKKSSKGSGLMGSVDEE